MVFASECSDTKADREDQVSWGSMGYSNWQRKCSYASFALIGCHEPKIVEKVKALTFKTLLCSFSSMVMNLALVKLLLICYIEIFGR